MGSERDITYDDLAWRSIYGMTVAEAARDLGVSYSTASYLADKLGVGFEPSTRGRPRLREPAEVRSTWRERHRALVEAELRACAAEGLTRREAAERAGVSLATVHNYASCCGIKFQRGGTGVRDVDRAAAMAEAYANGEMLEEIAARQDPPITRERVRQIIKKYFGMTGADGGRHARHVRRVSADRARREAACLEKCGCTLAQLAHLRSLG